MNQPAEQPGPRPKAAVAPGPTTASEPTALDPFSDANSVAVPVARQQLEQAEKAFENKQYEAAARVSRVVLEAEREELIRLRDVGRLPDSSLRVLERELDHQENLLPARPAG